MWTGEDGIQVVSDRPKTAGARAFGTAGVRVARVTSPQLMSRSTRYESLIHQHARLQGVRPDLVRAVIQVESAFNPRAISPKGAMGLMQLMPATAADLGVIDPFNPAENIRGGVTYLRQLLDRYDHDERLALAAYNAGPGAVDRYGARIPPYRETRNYVQRITGLNGSAGAPGNVMFKVPVTMANGSTTFRYTNVRPPHGNFEVVRR
jgi:soluble lytic murein transglycosylase-like protein